MARNTVRDSQSASDLRRTDLRDTPAGKRSGRRARGFGATLLQHDPILLFLVALISLVGLAFIFSAGYPRAMASEGSLIPGEFRNQLILGVIAIGSYLFAASRPREVWKKRAKLITLLSFLSLIAVEFVGVAQNGAKRWIGVSPILLQPAEFAKLAIILYLAAIFATRAVWVGKPQKSIERWLEKIAVPKIERAWPFLVVIVFAVLIEMEKDLGTAAVVMVTSVAMLFYGGISNKSKIALVLLLTFGAYGLAKKEAYRMERITSLSSRWDKDKVDEEGFQTVQSELAMASGGATGVGIGNGRGKYILPATTTDYIMATVAEEAGVAGPIIALALIGGIVARLWSLAMAARDRFSSLTLMGIATWLTVQATTNLMMANATLPSIGIPFPFISSGGSSLIALWLAMGVAQSVAVVGVTRREKNRIEAEEEEDAVRRHRWGNGRARLSGA